MAQYFSITKKELQIFLNKINKLYLYVSCLNHETNDLNIFNLKK